jgi:type I restriction enzyme S subunit
MINMGEIFAYERIGSIKMDRVPLSGEEIDRYSVMKGDLLFARQSLVAAGAGKCSIVMEANETTTFESHLIRVRLDELTCSPSFYFYYFLSPQGNANVQSLVMQVAAAGIRGSELAKLHVPVPPLHIQRRIAAILSAYDDLIENNQRRIKVLELMARTLYREWFINFRYPGHESVTLVPTRIGPVPEGWGVDTVGQIASCISRGPSLKYVSFGGVQVINQRCVRNEEIEMQAVQFALPLSAKNLHLYLQPRDILINSMGVGTLGRVSRNLSIDVPTIIHNCITVVRAKPDEPTTAYLYYRLSDSQEHFESLGIGATGQTSLRIETVRDVQIARPPRQILESFEGAVLPMWSQIGYLKREIRILRRTRDLLLPRLISGELDVESLAA